MYTSPNENRSICYGIMFLLGCTYTMFEPKLYSSRPPDEDLLLAPEEYIQRDMVTIIKLYTCDRSTLSLITDVPPTSSVG